MGGFYGSVQVRGEDREALRTILEDLARRHKNRFWLGPNLGGWIGVYPILHGHDPGVARGIARRLGGELFHLMVHDDDVFAYEYYHDRKRIDQYSSRPDSFGVLPLPARKSLRGRPETFMHLAIDPARFASFQARIAEQPTRPVTFASELLTLLATALGLSNYLVNYEDLSDSACDVERWDEFVHIPDLGVEQARHRKADAVLLKEAERLLREGSLLAERGGQRGRQVPSPHWCPSDGGASFFVAWTPPEFTSRDPVPLERFGSPWSAAPVATGLTIDPTVMQLVPSPSGQYLAIACSGGDARAAAWHVGDRRCVARLPHGYAAFQVGFLPDESAMICVGASVDSGEIGILPLGFGTPRFVAFSRPKLAVVHPAGRTLAVLDGRNRISVLELSTGRLERTLFVNGVRPPMDAAYFLGPDAPRDWLTMAPETLEDLLKRRQDALLHLYEQQIRSQPGALGESLRKKARAQVEKLRRQASVALATTRAPGWLEEKSLSGEFVTQLAFDPPGERLFVATFAGVRVYRWREVLEASGELPPPAFAVNFDPWLKQTPEGAVSRTSFVAALAYDPDRDRLLFGGQEGRVRSLDLADGQTDILLEPPGRPAIGRLALSRDRTVLGVTCEPEIDEEGPIRRAAVLQFWDYPALCRSL